VENSTLAASSSFLLRSSSIPRSSGIPVMLAERKRKEEPFPPSSSFQFKFASAQEREAFHSQTRPCLSRLDQRRTFRHLINPLTGARARVGTLGLRIKKSLVFFQFFRLTRFFLLFLSFFSTSYKRNVKNFNCYNILTREIHKIKLYHFCMCISKYFKSLSRNNIDDFLSEDKFQFLSMDIRSSRVRGSHVLSECAWMRVRLCLAKTQARRRTAKSHY